MQLHTKGKFKLPPWMRTIMASHRGLKFVSINRKLLKTSFDHVVEIHVPVCSIHFDWSVLCAFVVSAFVMEYCTVANLKHSPLMSRCGHRGRTTPRVLW